MERTEPTAITDSTGTTSRTYDELGRVLTKTVPGMGTTVFTYDGDEGGGLRSETTRNPKGNLTEKVYDKAGRLYKVIADGKATTYEYYADGLNKTLVNKKADGSSLDSYSYTYDGAHNQISKTDAKGVTSYEYDSLNRLEKVTEPNGRTTSYTFDKAGNRLTETVLAAVVTTSPAVTAAATATTTTATTTTTAATTTVTAPAISSVTTSYTYNEQNRLISTVQQSGRETITEKYSYDSNGNTIAKRKETVKPADPEVTGGFSLSVAGRSSTSSEATYYQYDVWNQLAKTTAGSKTISYSYNGEGYRTAKTENGQRTNYLYEADRVILETDANGNETARNIYGINLLTRTAGSDTINYMYNGHGDVTALLGEDGTVKGTYYYDAFGNIVGQTGNVNNNITYAGYQYDAETDLYYLNARYYDSKIARFLTQDTYTGDPNDPLSLNLYTYCHNEPVMYLDPSGHAAAYLTDLAKATNGTAKLDSEKKVAVVTVNGITQTFKLSANSVVNGKIVIDNEKFDSLFTKTSGNSLITVDTTVKNGKITATQTVKSGTYTVAQTSLAGQTNNYYKYTHSLTSVSSANKTNSTVNKGTGNGGIPSVSVLLGTVANDKGYDIILRIPRDRYPDSAKHIEDAIRWG